MAPRKALANHATLKQSVNGSTNKQESIKKEHQMRQQRTQDLNDQLTQDTDLTSKFLHNFESYATNAANTFLTDLEQELTNRFDH